MFIAQAYKSLHEFWRYLIGSVVIIMASLIGQVPMIIGIVFKNGTQGLEGIDESNIYSIFDKNTTFFFILLSFVFALGGILLVVKLFHLQKFKDMITTRPKFDWGRVWFSFGLISFYIIISTLIAYFMAPDEIILDFNLTPFIILFVLAIVFVPIQTSVEEFVFRGYLMQGFGILAKNKWFPLVMTSVIFGGMHYFNPEIGVMGDIAMVFYIGTGFLLGIMTLMDEGMELALGFHAGNNLITALLITADWTAFQTDSIFRDFSDPKVEFLDILVFLIIYPIFLLIFAYKYKWKGWKEKLFGPVEKPQESSIEEHLAAD